MPSKKRTTAKRAAKKERAVSTPKAEAIDPLDKLVLAERVKPLSPVATARNRPRKKRAACRFILTCAINPTGFE
jgi:hypothetical protein